MTNNFFLSIRYFFRNKKNIISLIILIILFFVSGLIGNQFKLPKKNDNKSLKPETVALYLKPNNIKIKNNNIKVNRKYNLVTTNYQNKSNKNILSTQNIIFIVNIISILVITTLITIKIIKDNQKYYKLLINLGYSNIIPKLNILIVELLSFFISIFLTFIILMIKTILLKKFSFITDKINVNYNYLYICALFLISFIISLIISKLKED